LVGFCHTKHLLGKDAQGCDILLLHNTVFDHPIDNQQMYYTMVKW